MDVKLVGNKYAAGKTSDIEVTRKPERFDSLASSVAASKAFQETSIQQSSGSHQSLMPTPSPLRHFIASAALGCMLAGQQAT